MSEDNDRKDDGSTTKFNGNSTFCSGHADQVLDNVLEVMLVFLTSRHDRNAASLVSKFWYRIEALTRSELFISNCYAVSPRRVTARFKQVRSVTLKGKPCIADFNLMPLDWGANFTCWVTAMAEAYPMLEKLRLKRMLVTNKNLALVARSFPCLKGLVLASCDDFGTSGLAMVATHCR